MARYRTTTRGGALEGVATTGAVEFLGVPYARPPVGARRLAPPEPPATWSGVRDATRPAPAPLQPPGEAAGPGPTSEDCLYANVWTPGLEGAPRPVLVLLHPGGFRRGSIAREDFAGARLARRGDVVVASVQHRLGPLGFLYADDVSPNLGLRDLEAALDWVHDEIDAFGGDPDNVTLVGFGAGATAAACLLTRSGVASNVRRAALHGARFGVHSPSEAGRASRAWLDWAELPGDVERLRTTAGERLSDAGPARLLPVVDGKWLTRPPLQALCRDVASLPLMLGANRHDVRGLAARDPELLELDEEGLLRALSRRHDTGDATLVRGAVEQYRVLAPEASPSEIFFELESDRLYQHPLEHIADDRARRGESVWAYRFDYGPLPQGAFHGAELPFVLGTLEQSALFAGREVEPSAKRLARDVQDALLRFARSDDPDFVDFTRWRAWDPRRPRTLAVGRGRPRLLPPSELGLRFIGSSATLSP